MTSTQGCLVTLLMVIITAVRGIINQLATRGPLSSSSTVIDSETDNIFWTLIVLIDAKSNRFQTLIFTQNIDHDLGARSLSTEQF